MKPNIAEELKENTPLACLHIFQEVVHQVLQNVLKNVKLACMPRDVI
jgi:hypothetical protein